MSRVAGCGRRHPQPRPVPPPVPQGWPVAGRFAWVENRSRRRYAQRVPPHATPRSSAALRIALILAAILALGAHAWHYVPYVVDDAFISLRYARRLLDGHGLTWTDGERVEGYSNLSWVLGCALLGLTRLDLVICARVLGLVCSAGTVVALGAPYRSTSAVIAACFGAAFAAPLAVWATAGLEQPLLAACLSAAVALAVSVVQDGAWQRGRRLWLGASLGLLSITRPDGALLAAAILSAVAITGTPRRTAVVVVLVAGALAASFVLAQIVFRIAYYGEIVPNTAFAKIAFGSARLQNGIQVLSRAGWPLCPFWMTGIGGLWLAARDPERRSAAHIIGLPLFAWCLYVLLVAGDNFPVHRSLVPALVLCLFGAAEGMSAWERRGRLGRTLPAMACALLALSVWTQWSDEERLIAANSRPTRTFAGQVIGGGIAASFGTSKPLVAVDAAGMIPYYAGTPAIDMLGLCDKHIARTKPPDFGRGLPGHELGDGDYVLSREPDLIVWGNFGEPSPMYRGGAQMTLDARFQHEYVRIRWLGTEPFPLYFSLFVRRNGKVGFTAASDRVFVPGYLFATTPSVFARSVGVAVVHVHEGAFGSLDHVPLSAARWTVRLTGDEGASLAVVRESDETTVAVAESAAGEIPTLDHDGTPVRLVVRALREANVAGVTFERVVP